MHRIPFNRDAQPISAPHARRMLDAAGFNVIRTDYLFLFPRVLAPLRRLEAGSRPYPPARSTWCSAASAHDTRARTARRQLAHRSCAPSGSGVRGPCQPAVDERATGWGHFSRERGDGNRSLVTSGVVRLVSQSFSEPAIVHDERAHFLQAAMFARGHWTVASPPIPAFFEQMHVFVSQRSSRIPARSRRELHAGNVGRAPGSDAGAPRRNRGS